MALCISADLTVWAIQSTANHLLFPTFSSVNVVPFYVVLVEHRYINGVCINANVYRVIINEMVNICAMQLLRFLSWLLGTLTAWSSTTLGSALRSSSRIRVCVSHLHCELSALLLSNIHPNAASHLAMLSLYPCSSNEADTPWWYLCSLYSGHSLYVYSVIVCKERRKKESVFFLSRWCTTSAYTHTHACLHTRFRGGIGTKIQSTHPDAILQWKVDPLALLSIWCKSVLFRSKHLTHIEARLNKSFPSSVAWGDVVYTADMEAIPSTWTL